MCVRERDCVRVYYECMCVCVCVCAGVCACVWFACMHACMYVSNMSIYIYMYVSNMSIYIYIYVSNMSIYIYIPIYIYIYTAGSTQGVCMRELRLRNDARQGPRGQVFPQEFQVPNLW